MTFSQQPNRIEPSLGAHQMKTYTVAAPTQTHHRRATCEEANCSSYRLGWRVRVETLTPELLHSAKNSGRRYTELAVTEGETYLVFEAGQSCFRTTTHTVPNDRPALYLVRPGDYRYSARPDEIRVHSGADAWVDDLRTHIDPFIAQAAQG